MTHKTTEAVNGSTSSSTPGHRWVPARRRDWRWPARIKRRTRSANAKSVRQAKINLYHELQDTWLHPAPHEPSMPSVSMISLIHHANENNLPIEIIQDSTATPGGSTSNGTSKRTYSNKHYRRHSKLKVAATTAIIFKSFTIVYLLQQIASFGHHIYPPRVSLALALSTSDYQNRPRQSLEVREHIDGLLTSTSYKGPAGETPLDFVKQVASADDRRPAGNLQDQQHRRRRQHHGHHRSHHWYSQKGRSKRNNLAEGYLESGADRPVVVTNKGPVRGITQKIFTNKFVDAYLGIPFAQPPTGDYRFRHPQPVNPWQGEFDASHMSSSCYQVNDTFFGSNFMGTSIWNANTRLDEDCLYLNIWTPFAAANTTIPSSSNIDTNPRINYESHRDGSTSQGAKIAKRPVLVWIFGGGFYSGTSTLKIYEGGALASEEDIIVVSMNYRVSSLGFLYFGRPDAPGNAGLFDQLLALQWINDNIDQFGGDPERVTIFGESAGAVSVAFHMLSPLSRNLFSQAILQSGAATCPWGSMDTKEIMANGLQLAQLLNCPSNPNDLDAVIKCLLKADPMALVSQEVGQTRSVLNFPFVPVVDGSFLLESPTESLAKANFKSARILLGSNNNEANAFLIYLPEFSNCPANGNSDQQLPLQPPSGAPPTSEIRLQRPTDDDQDQSVSEMGDHTAVAMSSDVEKMNLLTFERQTSTQRTVSSGMNNNATGFLQPVASSVQSSTKTTQKQQQQANAQNADISKPCKPNEYISLSRDDFLSMLREDLNPYAGHKIGKKAIVFEYSNWNNPLDPVSHYDAIDKIVGDYYFTCHVNEFAYHYAQAGNAVYMYYFKHRSTMSPWPKWMGVLHGDEINFVFGEPLNPVYNYTQKEVDLSRRIMKYWANFARYGDPTPKTGDNTSTYEHWPEYKDKRQYFELNSDYIRIGRGPRAKQCAFWSQYLPQLIQSYDNNNQCHVPSNGKSLHLYPHPSGHQQSGKYVYPRLTRDFLPFASVPSAILFIFIFIIIIIGLVGTYIIYTKGFTWKFDLWPSTGDRSTNDDDDETDGGASTSRHGVGEINVPQLQDNGQMRPQRLQQTRQPMGTPRWQRQRWHHMAKIQLQCKQQHRAQRRYQTQALQLLARSLPPSSTWCSSHRCSNNNN